MTDLISVLAGKQTPQFGNITGLEQLKDILNEGTKSASSGRDKILDNNSAMLGKVIDLLKLKPEIDKSNNSETGEENKPESGKPTSSVESGTTTGSKPTTGTGGNDEIGKDNKPETRKLATSEDSG